ncbi:MAG: hypothetical protein Q9163_000028 [Psora crenata]
MAASDTENELLDLVASKDLECLDVFRISSKSGLMDTSFFINAQQDAPIVVEGRTRFDRLYLIGRSSPHLCLDALRAAIAEAKRSSDVRRYEKAVSALAKAAPSDPDAEPDTLWVARMKKLVKAETDRMELELKGYKNNLIKESIRVKSSPDININPER